VEITFKDGRLVFQSLLVSAYKNYNMHQGYRWDLRVRHRDVWFSVRD